MPPFIHFPNIYRCLWWDITVSKMDRLPAFVEFIFYWDKKAISR